MLSVAPVSSPLEWVPLLGESSPWGSQLEWPQEVVGLLEVSTHRVNLVYQVLHRGDAVLAKSVLYQLVVGERDPLLVDLAEAALVDQLLD